MTETTNSSEPLPCPFCGIVPEVIMFVTDKLMQGFMCCYACGAIGPSTPQPASKYGQAIADAARADRRDETKALINRMNEEWRAEALRLWNQRASVGTTAMIDGDRTVEVGIRGEGDQT